MADFTNTENTGNNPDQWLTNYAYNTTTDVVSIDLSSALTPTGVTNDDLEADQGDARSVYLAVAEALFLAYDAKDDTTTTTSNRLKMTRSQAVDSTNDIRYTTYTIHVQEEGTGTAESFSSTGVRAE